MFQYDKATSSMYLYDEIGASWYGGITESMVIEALAEAGDNHVNVRINTPGGSVDTGIAIYNALKRHKGGVTTYVDSLAASMGSYLMLAADRRVIAENGMVMIHNPWTFAYGDAVELRKTADVLDKYLERQIPDYAKASGKTADEIKELLDAETWYTGQEAVDAGFATEIESESTVEMKVNDAIVKGARRAPAAFFARLEKAKRQVKFPARESAMHTSAMITKWLSED